MEIRNCHLVLHLLPFSLFFFFWGGERQEVGGWGGIDHLMKLMMLSSLTKVLD